MKEKYKYFAFISYRGVDVEIAKKLQKKFNNFKLPSTYVNPFDENNQRMQPVCRDRDTFVGGDVTAQIHDAIDHSMYVVMVCTPNMTQSDDQTNYVNDEVRHLIETGRIDRLIPLVFDGRAYAPDDYTKDNRDIKEPFLDECLPFALREWMYEQDTHDFTLNIFNIEEQGEHDEDKMFLRCVATILAEEFNKLWDRFKEDQKKRRRNIAISVVSIIIAFILAVRLTYLYEYYQEQPFESKISVKETIKYPNLPSPKEIEISICLDGIWRRDTISQMGESAVFKGILAKYKKEPIKLQVRNVCFLPLDTTITLRDNLQIPLHRDSAYYGEIFVLLLDNDIPISNQIVSINGINHMTDANGRLKCRIPIEQQSESYIIGYNGKRGQLYMPCGVNDCLHLN